MSGIEVAGIVLAVFGALVNGVGGYNEVVTGRDVSLLVDSLENNKIIFSNSIEHLLRSIVSADELTRLLNDTTGSLWADSGLNQRAIANLGPNARRILQKIDEIRKTIVQLQRKLPVQEDDATVVARAKHVIKCFVRGSYYGASLERLKIRIREFCILTNGTLKLASTRGVSLHSLKQLSIVERCASWLHDALKGGWKCSCEGSHPANIQLDVWSPQTAAGGEEDAVCLYFSLLFADNARQAQHDHWITAEITTSRTSLDEVRPLFVRTLSSTQVGNPSVRTVPSSIAPSLAQSGPTDGSSLTISTATQVNQGTSRDPRNTSDDLCPITKDPPGPPRMTRRRLGSISDKDGHNYDLFSQPDAATARTSMTLAEVYKKRNVLSNKNRVQLALTLAWSVLQISTTSWLKGKWTKDNIFLVMDTPTKPMPYLSHRFESSRRRDSLLPSTLSPTTVDQVGVWVGNTSLFALGVFLLEMCFDHSIEDLAVANEKNAHGDAFEYTPILTAKRLSKLTQDQLGINYAQAVDACLNFPNIDMDADGKPTDFSEFATIVMRDIINPLQDLAEVYNKRVVAG